LAGYGISDEQVVALAGTAAGFVSFLAAILSNFLWNRYWTYPDSRSKSLRRQFAQFVLVSLAGIIIRVPLMAFTTPLFIRLTNTAAALRPLADRIGSNLALMLAVVVVMFWNFFVNRYWTYADVGK
jgi:putative flippase GtrA